MNVGESGGYLGTKTWEGKINDEMLRELENKCKSQKKNYHIIHYTLFSPIKEMLKLYIIQTRHFI